MKKQYIQLWLTLIFILVIFPPAITGSYSYEGHMFITEIGKHKPRLGGGYIEGQILWSRLLFEALIVTLFVAVLKVFDVLEKLKGRRACALIPLSTKHTQMPEKLCKESHLSIDKIGDCIHAGQAIGEIVYPIPAEFKELKIVGYQFMARLPVITLDDALIKATPNDVFKGFNPIELYSSSNVVKIGTQSCYFKFIVLDANLVLEIFPDSLLTEYIVFGLYAAHEKSTIVDRMESSLKMMDLLPAFNPKNSHHLELFVEAFLKKFGE